MAGCFPVDLREADTFEEKMSEHDDTLCDETSASDGSDDSMEQPPSLEKKSIMETLLQNLGLTKYYNKKITLNYVLQTEKDSIIDKEAQSLSDLPWLILKRLMMLKTTARSVKCSSQLRADADDSDWEDDDDDDQECYESDDAQVNPLDIFTALFLCSDSFLQQEMVLKMSMCQFAVPLLLPNSDKNQITLMLWALRGIVQQYRPHSLTDASGFVEERIVLSDMPLVSFVRLGRCNISKSHILNKLLSKSQQSTDIFLHHNLDCGDIHKKISNGVVEVSWYFPCGNKNIDAFPEPVAIANMRGDIQDFETQYSFLCKTSTAVFVFFENKLLDTRYISVPSEESKLQLFLVGDSRNESIRKTAENLNLKKHNFLFKAKQNDADFVNKIRSKMQDAIQKNSHRISVVRLAETAREFGIMVDEDDEECQKANQRADEITSAITDTEQFKKKELPLQGEIMKTLAKLEKEECRLKEVGDQNIELYKDHIHFEKLKLRKQQYATDMSATMNSFMKGMSCPREERAYFLKWMRMNLENLSQKILPNLRKQYKKKRDAVCENKDDIAELDRKISNSSLGIEHFIREMGQLYEAAVILSTDTKSHNRWEHLPRLCAEILLHGFPLELIDGNASSVPVNWVTSVFSELNTLVKPNNKIVVVTVLGVQSSGKSTLLNTMFGLQFAVSSGRCTKGAFIQLIRVTEDFKTELNLDYLLIVDTEGLKSIELAILDNSQEHDNELATLVVGLSDVTIVNITMENSTEIKDILQIVVHAFIRMKDIGKKHKCLFVHQNVGNISAHDSNMRDRQFLLKQLNEMTQAAARMENKLEIQKFTDVMEYGTETDHYIPGLWHGNPPMAQVSTGYSESVYALKRHILDIFRSCKSGSISEFIDWTKSLWDAVKFEKFIFSFRNSMVADAYIKLCTECNRWDWALRKQMHTWMLEAETKILNHGKFEITEKCTIEDVHCVLAKNAEHELSKGEKDIIDKITTYYEQGEGHVELVERYRQDFISGAKFLRTELSNSIKRKLDAALSRRNAMIKVGKIKKTYMETMEKKVLDLLKDCRKKRSSDMSDETLDEAFENMWQETVKALSCTGLHKQDIMDKVLHNLRKNLELRGGLMAESLNKVSDLTIYGHKKFVVVAEITTVSELPPDDWISKVQEMSNSLIDDCKNLMEEKRASKADYDDTYVREILNNIDEKLKAHENLRITEDLELSLKLHICGFTGQQFQDIHNQFILDNDPLTGLEKFKQTYHSNFKDLFHERDQCQKKAHEFTNVCIKPAVQNYIPTILGTEMAEVMLTGENAKVFETRTHFQNFVLKDLLDKFEFKIYAEFIGNYGLFVKNFISNKVIEHFSTENRMSELEESLVSLVTKEIIQAITDTEQNTETNDIKKFIQSICKKLEHRLVFSTDAVDAFLSLSNVNQKQFATILKSSVEEMNQSLKKTAQETYFRSKLEQLQTKPEDVLFERVWGCGKQCPLCTAPCEAGGVDHTKHFVSVHRPAGLKGYKNHLSKKLATNICSTSVHSKMDFGSSDTKNEPHPYKKYREIYPDWEIQPDPRIECSAYWKYVMANFNEQFAEEYNGQPADIPTSWKIITRDQAEQSIRCNN